MKRLIAIIGALISLTVAARWAPAWATITVEVSGNGSQTENSADVTATQTSQVNQTNTSLLSQQISQSANTGNNLVDTSERNVTVTTGDSVVDSLIETKQNTSVVVVDPCCSGEQKIAVVGNGSESKNQVSVEQNTSTHVDVIQQATSISSSNTKISSGENTVIGGNEVTIITGSIVAKERIITSANQGSFIVPSDSAASSYIFIKNNGTESNNSVVINLDKNFILTKFETTSTNNNVYANLSTGNNQVLDNLNKVIIETGKIDSELTLSSSPVNQSGTEVYCCDDGLPTHPPTKPDDNPRTVPPSPTSPSAAGTGGAASGASGGNSTIAQAIGGTVIGALTQVLPATGASALHFWILAVIYLLMFLSGLYVRLRAGRSPTQYNVLTVV